VTADEGTCTIVLPPWAPSGTIHIEAHADGFTPQEGDWTFKNGVTVRLSPAVTLTGRVIEADTGTSAIGAELLLSAENSKFRATTTTSNTGAYVIEGAPAGRKVYLSVKDTRREYPRVVESFTIDPQAPAPHDVALQPGIRVEGQVVDLLTDAPLSGVSLTFNGDACGESTASGAILAFVPASVRAAQLRFHLPGYCVYRWDEFRPGISDRSPFVIRMLPSAGVEGIAVDDGGAPLEGVRISVSGVPALNVPSGNSVQPPEWTWLSKLPEGVVIEHTEPFISLLTDKSGRFRCNGLIPASDEVEVYASAEGMHSTKDLVALRTPGEWKQVRLVLSHAPLDTGTVRGHLRFNGRPCAGKIEWRNGSESGEGSANIRGEYLLDRVAPGDVTLTSTPQSLEVFRRAPDYELGIQPETLTIRALEEATHEIDVRCPMSTITGHVRSASGTAQNAGVVLTTTDRAHLWISQAVHGDAEFRFEVPLVPREYTLRASAGGAVQEREHVHPGDHNIDLVIGPHGRLRVRAFDREDHSLISPLDAWLRPTGSQDYIRDPELGGSRDDGFRTISLPTGTYDVSLHCDERGYAPTTLNDVRIEDGKDAEREVQFEKGLDLQLQLGEGSADLSPDAQLYVIEAEWEAQVSFVGASGRMEIRAQGDAQSIDLSTRRASFGADRHAHIGGLRAGKYRLKCHPPSLALEPATLLVSTSSASPITIDVHVP
jgi:hypothetical protein